MSGFDFDAPEDVAGESTYLNEPGTYHVVVTSVGDGVGPKGNPIDGFTIGMETLAGTSEGCHGKSHGETLFKPKFTDKDSAQLASRRKLAALFIACDLMRPDQLGKPVQLDIASMVDRQFVVRLARQMDKDSAGKYTIPSKFLQIDYAAIFHVDDPEVKDIPKHVEALEMLEATQRHKPEYFAFKAKKVAEKKELATAGTGVKSSDFDDI